MHRFYAFHSFTLFHRNSIAAAAFFLAAKVQIGAVKFAHLTHPPFVVSFLGGGTAAQARACDKNPEHLPGEER